MILCWLIVLHPKSWIKSENGPRLVALKLQSLTEMILTNTLLHPKNGSAKLSHIEWMQEEIWYISSTLSNLKHKTGDKRVAPVLSHTGDHTGWILVLVSTTTQRSVCSSWCPELSSHTWRRFLETRTLKTWGNACFFSKTSKLRLRFKVEWRARPSSTRHSRSFSC